MGAPNTWNNAMEVAEEAGQDYGSQILSSSLTVDPSESPPDMNRRIMFVIMPLCPSLSNAGFSYAY